MCLVDAGPRPTGPHPRLALADICGQQAGIIRAQQTLAGEWGQVSDEGSISAA